jgi:hypothetical protein
MEASAYPAKSGATALDEEKEYSRRLPLLDDNRECARSVTCPAKSPSRVKAAARVVLLVRSGTPGAYRFRLGRIVRCLVLGFDLFPAASVAISSSRYRPGFRRWPPTFPSKRNEVTPNGARSEPTEAAFS